MQRIAFRFWVERQTDWKSTSLLPKGTLSSVTGIKRPGREANYSTPLCNKTNYMH